MDAGWALPVAGEARYFWGFFFHTMRELTCAFLLVAAMGCTPSEPADNATTTTPSTTTGPTSDQTAGTAERDAWQMPQEVFLLMGNDLRGRTIADLAARDGYFTFKLIGMGANVIAIDDDPQALAAIEARKKAMGLSDARLRTRLVPLGQAGLAPDEVDACLLVHSYVRIPDKKLYLTQVFQGTKVPKPLFILEWLNGATPIGPPASERISSDRIMDDIGLAGYSDVGAYSAKIPHQVFLFASLQTGDEAPMEGMPQDQLITAP